MSANANEITYSFNDFVADEPQVLQWPHVEPGNPEAIKLLTDTYFESNYDIWAMLKVIFTSDFVKDEAVRLPRLKSPAELIAGTYRIAGGFEYPAISSNF